MTVGCIVPRVLGAETNTSSLEPLVVMSWNLEWFYDDMQGDNYSDLAREKSAPTREDWNWRRDAIAESIAEVRPTIAALQEVESRRVLWYLSRALDRNHSAEYRELGIQGEDHFTEQDVPILFRKPAEALLVSRLVRSGKQRADQRFYDVSKHLLAVFQFPAGDRLERVTLMNVHLRAGVDGEEVRKRQARMVHLWIADAVASGENVILLGDTNTEQRGDQTDPGSDVGIIAGRETSTTQDDLIDLTLRIARPERQTHLLRDRQFDRILVSRSLIQDTPGQPDLVFRDIHVARDLAIRGEPDAPQDHWDRYWQMPENERDLSDHFPVIATFDVK